MKKATAKKQKIKTTLNNTAHGKYRHHRAGMRGGCKASREGRKDRHLDGGQKPRVREESGEESPEEDLGHRDNVGTPWLEREARAGVQDMEGAQSGEAKLECVSHASLCGYLWVGSWL